MGLLCKARPVRVPNGLAALLLALASGLPASARAHHSSSMYDTAHPLQLAGSVTSFDWQNPHSLLRLRATDAGGRRVDYELECDSITQLQKHGWTRDAIVPGSRVTVVVALRRDLATRGEVLTLTLADGRQLRNRIGR